jgi:L-ascorbate metabolism protein UlaG (beta-lactamase superfamily)
MKYILPLLFIVIFGCKSTTPGTLRKLTKHGIPYQSQRSALALSGTSEKKISIQYLGCGGLYIVKGDDAIMVDPFFSNQKVMRLGTSIFGGGGKGKRKLASDPKMIERGLKAIKTSSGNMQPQIKAILSAHSHYDHLMDVPAIFKRLEETPQVYINRSGFNTCHNVINVDKMVVLENYMTTQEVARPPIELKIPSGKINIYPILSEHNPHFKNIKFFSGSKATPVDYFRNPYQKTRANDWLEGNTFSFLVDFIDANGGIEFRIFIQSSSCNPPAGIPPAQLLQNRNVDMAFLGVVSYQFSPDYPCSLLQALKPKEVVWIHWEDFFRKYTKKPKAVRGTDVKKFFDLHCVKPYKSKALLPWPGVTFDISY